MPDGANRSTPIRIGVDGLRVAAAVDRPCLVQSPSFFNLDKRPHSYLHGFDGDAGKVSDGKRGVYEATLTDNARELASMLRPDDVVILHNHQTAGLIDARLVA